MSNPLPYVCLASALALLGCGSSEPLPSREWRVGSPEHEVAADRRGYFPAGPVDEFRRGWYSKHFVAARESPLFGSDAQTAYRLTFLPSFSHPLIVRIEERTEGSLVVAKELDGAGGYDPGEVLIEKHRPLARGEWERLVAEIDAMQFWQTPTHACAGRSHHHDGAVWILEGNRGGEYQLSEWHWPECSVCLQLLELSELDLPTGYGLPIESEPPFPPPPALPPLLPWN